MNLKIVSPLTSSVEFSALDEEVTNSWPLMRGPKEIHPQGIPILFRPEEIAEISIKPIAWPCDDATDRWISEYVDESFHSTPEEPETYQPFEF